MANSMTINDGMKSRVIKMTLHRQPFRVWVLYHDIDGRKKNFHAIKVDCGFKLLSITRQRNAYMCVTSIE